MLSLGCTGVVLAGGASSRFGGAHKGLMALGGQRIVDRVLGALRGAADDVLVVANDPDIRSALPGVRTRGDERSERGGLVGLYTALSLAEHGALVVAWDMPFVNTDLLKELRRLGEQETVAVVPDGPHGLEPLCAYYPRSCLGFVERQITVGNLRLGTLVRSLPARRFLPLARVADFGDPERLFLNINSRLDLEAAQRWLESTAAASTPDLSPSGHQ